MKNFVRILERLHHLGGDTEITFSVRAHNGAFEYIAIRVSAGARRYTTSIPIGHASRARGGVPMAIVHELEYVFEELKRLIEE